MYEAFFGLHQEPFSIAPDPRFLYMSAKHSEALVLLNLSLTRGASFVLLTGEIGAGKTTVWRRFLEQLPSNVDVASVVNPKLDVNALLTRIFEDLAVELPQGSASVDLIDALHGHLLLASAQGRRTLIAIDEAQALSMEVLEQLRLLTNLDSSGKKLQVMLIGQPEMREILERPSLEPLAQRVVARYHLPALSEAETAGYIAHRLNIAGLTGPLPFDGESIGLIHRLCGGLPRRINVLCDRALEAAQAAGTRRVRREIIESAAVQAFGARVAKVHHGSGASGSGWAKALAFAGVAGLALAAGVYIAPRLTSAPAVDAAPSAAVATAPPPAPPAPAPVAAPATTPRPVAVGSVVPAPVTVAAVEPAITRTAVAMPARPPAFESAFTPAASDEASALRALAARWGVTLAAGEPCSAALQQALQCFRTRGGLAAIRLLDRPGVLRLVDEHGRVAQALLLALRGDEAVLAIAGAERQVTVTELARWWRGEFVTLWRAPPGYREGETSVGTAWLADQLGRADTRSPPPVGDAQVRARIFAFQIAQGLTPDGVAGPLTLMQLNRANGVDEPRLVPTSGSRPS